MARAIPAISRVIITVGLRDATTALRRQSPHEVRVEVRMAGAPRPLKYVFWPAEAGTGGPLDLDPVDLPEDDDAVPRDAAGEDFALARAAASLAWSRHLSVGLSRDVSRVLDALRRACQDAGRLRFAAARRRLTASLGEGALDHVPPALADAARSLARVMEELAH